MDAGLLNFSVSVRNYNGKATRERAISRKGKINMWLGFLTQHVTIATIFPIMRSFWLLYLVDANRENVKRGGLKGADEKKFYQRLPLQRSCLTPLGFNRSHNTNTQQNLEGCFFDLSCTTSSRQAERSCRIQRVAGRQT